MTFIRIAILSFCCTTLLAQELLFQKNRRRQALYSAGDVFHGFKVNPGQAEIADYR
jgi:hypothetical protein